jgi:Leucine-rich repeat (LRR) protein
LEGELNLSDFKNLERLDCSKNHLDDLNLVNCKSLKELKCSNNKIKNFDFLTPICYNLKKLDISDCYLLGGSLNFSRNLIKLEKLNISNTNISKGLECLPGSCKYLFCNSD